MTKKILILTLLILLLQCANTNQIVKGNAKEGSKNIGYLKLKIIDSVNNGTFTKSTITLRGIEINTNTNPAPPPPLKSP